MVQSDGQPTALLEKATLGGGCFWCLEAVYELVDGVHGVVSGYAGGVAANPSYQLVCRGTSGHAEVVQIAFDPAVTSYRELLEIFFVIHDPTTLNRQGADVGSQYRSVIFTHSAEQQAAALAMIEELRAGGVFESPIVTTVEPCPPFYPAEEYHQHYYRDNGSQPYCQVVVSPKVAKFRAKFKAKVAAR